MKSSLVWVVQLKQGLLWLFSDQRVSNFPLDSLTPTRLFANKIFFGKVTKNFLFVSFFALKTFFHKSFVSYFWAKGWLGKKFLFAAKTTLVRSPSSSSSSPSTISNLFQRVKLLYRRKSVRFQLSSVGFSGSDCCRSQPRATKCLKSKVGAIGRSTLSPRSPKTLKELSSTLPMLKPSKVKS